MKVLIAGDVHGARNTELVLATADKLGIEVAIIVGDCWDVHADYGAYKCRPLFVEGNHEQPLYWQIGLERGMCVPDYHTFELDGAKFAAVSRIDEVNHDHLRTSLPWLYDALGPKPDIWMTKRELADIPFAGIDVLLCHDGPAPMVFEDPEGEPQTSGSQFLTKLVDTFKPQYVFHGHYHHFFDRVIGGTRVVGLNQVYGRSRNSMLVFDTVTKQVDRII